MITPMKFIPLLLCVLLVLLPQCTVSSSSSTKAQRPRKRSRKDSQRAREKHWEKYFRESDKIVTTYNTLKNDDSLDYEMGNAGTEVDPAYPEYFNENFTRKQLSKIHRKTYKMKHVKFDNLGNPVETILPMRYECEKMKEAFHDSCQIYRRLMQVEPSKTTKSMKLVDDEAAPSERMLRQLMTNARKTAKHRSFKHKRRLAKLKVKRNRTKHVVKKTSSRKRRLQGIPTKPVMVEAQMENSSITVTTFATPPEQQHYFIADNKQPKTSLIIPRFYLKSDTFKPEII